MSLIHLPTTCLSEKFTVTHNALTWGLLANNLPKICHAFRKFFGEKYSLNWELFYEEVAEE